MSKSRRDFPTISGCTQVDIGLNGSMNDRLVKETPKYNKVIRNINSRI